MPSGKRPMHSVSVRHHDGMHPAFSGRHPTLFIISDLYRVVAEIVEVHADIARSFFKCRTEQNRTEHILYFRHSLHKSNNM